MTATTAGMQATAGMKATTGPPTTVLVLAGTPAAQQQYGRQQLMNFEGLLTKNLSERRKFREKNALSPVAIGLSDVARPIVSPMYIPA
jgi:hypothetical protein